jgi:hypothetical protein
VESVAPAELIAEAFGSISRDAGASVDVTLAMLRGLKTLAKAAPSDFRKPAMQLAQEIFARADTNSVPPGVMSHTVLSTFAPPILTFNGGNSGRFLQYSSLPGPSTIAIFVLGGTYLCPDVGPAVLGWTVDPLFSKAGSNSNIESVFEPDCRRSLWDSLALGFVKFLRRHGPWPRACVAAYLVSVWIAQRL